CRDPHEAGKRLRAAALVTWPAAGRKPGQEVAVRCEDGHNYNRIYPNRRGSFPFSARLCMRRVAMREENGSRPFSPERYRAGLRLPKRLGRVLSASDVAHQTILKAASSQE